MHSAQSLTWSSIEASLDTLTETTGGYTTAQRGIVTLPGDTKVFVKIGHDDSTKQWASKETAVYRFLQKHHFACTPDLLAVNENETAFALEPLLTGWDWSNTWTTERLDATLAAMDALAQIVPEANDKPMFEQSFISETANGWQHLIKNADSQDILRQKLVAANRTDIAAIDFSAHAQRSTQFAIQRTALVHNDIRADNCAWNQDQHMVKLIDWSWAQLGDRRIDVGALLTHVHKSGFDVSGYTSRLNKDALHWLAGFWFNAATQPIMDGGAERATLRDHQLASGLVAFDLAHGL